MKIKTSFLSGLTAVMLVFIAGCAGMFPPPAQWKSEPNRATVENAQFKVILEPILVRTGYRAFVFSIINKTDRNIEINWNKTLYIRGGQTSGGFMFAGVVYKDRNNPKPPDIVFGNNKCDKGLLPNILVDYHSRKWRHYSMPQGENGVYLSLLIDGKEVNEHLVFNFTYL